jgi:hypothetical protein
MNITYTQKVRPHLKLDTTVVQGTPLELHTLRHFISCSSFSLYGHSVSVTSCFSCFASLCSLFHFYDKENQQSLQSCFLNGHGFPTSEIMSTVTLSTDTFITSSISLFHCKAFFWGPPKMPMIRPSYK